MQPVIPIGLTEHWNLISRTILPVIHQSDVIGDDSQTGLGERYYAERPSGGPDWGLRFGVTFLFPKK